MNLLRKGHLFFSIGALLFFSGIFFVYFLIEYSDSQSDIIMASSVVSAMMIIIATHPKILQYIMMHARYANPK